MWKLVAVAFILLSNNKPSCCAAGDKENMTLGVIISNWSGKGFHPIGQFPSISLALKHIGENSSILPHYNVDAVMLSADCLPGKGVQHLFDLLSEPPKKSIIIGAICSTVTQPTAATSAYFNVIQISPDSTSPALEDRVTYPNLYRMMMSENKLNLGILAAVKRFGWTRVATIHQNEDLFSLPMKDLIEKFTENNITVVTTETIQSDASLAVRNIKKKGLFIIVAYMYHWHFPSTFCEAYKHGMFGPKYVWLITGWVAPDTIEEGDTDDCTFEEWRLVYNYVMRFTGSYKTTELDKPTISGLTPTTFEKQFSEEAKRMAPWWNNDEEIAYFAKYTFPNYDSVWAAALALHRADATLRNEGRNVGAYISSLIFVWTRWHTYNRKS